MSGLQSLHFTCYTIVIVILTYFSDLLIDKGDSTRTKESWVSRKITVVCAVRVPESLKENAMFSWRHIPSNRTVARQFHDDMRSKSYLSIITNKDEDFETLQCRAETKATVKFHTINITRLSMCSIAGRFN